MEKEKKFSGFEVPVRILALMGVLCIPENRISIQAKTEQAQSSSYYNSWNEELLLSNNIRKVVLDVIKEFHPDFKMEAIPQYLTRDQFIEWMQNNLSSEKGKSPYFNISTQKKNDIETIRPSVFLEKEETNNDFIFPSIKITHFSKTTDTELSLLIKELKSKHTLSGIILNLEGNLGGDYATAIRVADLFMSQGFISKDRDIHTGKILEVHAATKNKLDIVDIPIVIRLNRNSASSSEVVTRALLRRKFPATTVGEKTRGKNIFQTVYKYRNIKFQLTTGRWTKELGAIIPQFKTSSSAESARLARSWKLEKIKRDMKVRQNLYIRHKFSKIFSAINHKAGLN